MAKHRDYGDSVNTGPFAYVGFGGDLYRRGYDEGGSTKVYRAEYNRGQFRVQPGRPFVLMARS